MRLRQFASSVADWCEGYVEFVYLLTLVIAEEATGWLLGDDITATRPQTAAQVQTIIAVVIVGVVALVGILVYSEVEGSISILDIQGARDDPDNATELENSSAAVGDGFGDAMELVPIVLIVLVAALVIGVVQRFR